MRVLVDNLHDGAPWATRKWQIISIKQSIKTFIKFQREFLEILFEIELSNLNLKDN